MAARRKKTADLFWIALTWSALIGLVLFGVLAFFPDSPEPKHSPPPFHTVSAYQTTEHLVVVVEVPPEYRERALLPLRVELLDSQGTSLDRAERNIVPGKKATTHRFELKPPRADLHRLTLRCVYDGRSVDRPMTEVLWSQAHETTVSIPPRLIAGNTALVHCAVRGVRSLTETTPIPFATVELRLVDTGAKVHPLFSGKTDAEGSLDVGVKVPKVPEGHYNLEVETTSEFGYEKLVRSVRVEQSPRQILLVTDKPVYQPGQVVRLRTLCLDSFDLSAIGDEKITFEVEDSRRNIVFQRTLITSDFGIASTDFPLAKEVNEGTYRIRAVLGEDQVQKTVIVAPYVLPRFEPRLTTDKPFYLSKETVRADLQVDYFFGKPVVGGSVEVKAFDSDGNRKEFFLWKGQTDERGHTQFEVEVPESVAGHAQNDGPPGVRFEVKVTDPANHTETLAKTYPVSNRAIEVRLIPEGGRLIPEMENRIFVSANHPDGSPATSTVDVWIGKERRGSPFASLKTNAAGLAEFSIAPQAELLRSQRRWRTVELLGGATESDWSKTNLLDFYVEVGDAKSTRASSSATLPSEPLGENLRLRLGKAIYQGGEPLGIEVQTSSGLPWVGVEVIRAGRTLLTKRLDVEAGTVSQHLVLPRLAFGRLEVHASHRLPSGEILRDSRVVYVQPATELKIDVQTDNNMFRPGESGRIRFAVTDGQGKPTPAALGVLVVDEAVYAQQEMQPGLEKVYFTLQQELLKPPIDSRPQQSLEELVRKPLLRADQQQIAEVLLTAIRPEIPQRWEVRPEFERRLELRRKLRDIGEALFAHCMHSEFLVEHSGRWSFEPDLLRSIRSLADEETAYYRDSFGNKLTLAYLSKLEPGFSAKNLGVAVTEQRIQKAYRAVVAHLRGFAPLWMHRDGNWTATQDILREALAHQRHAVLPEDAWGQAFRIVEREDAPNPLGDSLFAKHELVSAGPDGRFGTEDDVPLTQVADNRAETWWMPAHKKKVAPKNGLAWRPTHRVYGRPKVREAPIDVWPVEELELTRLDIGIDPRIDVRFALEQLEEVPLRFAKRPTLARLPLHEDILPVRTREYFPETMLWRPALITDERGVATMPIEFADSITSWRLTASASSRAGLLGGTTKPLRVFQDFFIELDLPVSLTLNDEVEFPVAIHNYLKTPQTVQVELVADAWFELLDGSRSRSLELRPDEVTAVSFRIRAKKIGSFPLTVNATGSEMSDAVRRIVEVVPDGKPIEQTASNRLEGTSAETLAIPQDAVPGASKLFVKIYPGVMSQVLEGAEGMLRLPSG